MANPVHKGTISETVDAPVEKVWAVLSTEDNTKNKSLLDLEQADISTGLLQLWKEHTPFSVPVELEIIDEEPMKFVKIELKENRLGMTGTWKYELEPEGNKTKVTITEHSTTERLFTRSLLNVLGRNSTMELHLKTLKKTAEML